MKTLGTGATRSSWLWIAAIWSGIGLFDAIQTVVVMRSEGMHHAWFLVVLDVTIDLAAVDAGDPVHSGFGAKVSGALAIGRGAWVRHLAGCGAIALLASAWIAVLNVVFNPYLTNAGAGTVSPGMVAASSGVAC